MSWTDDVRIIGGRTATFTGATSQSAGVSGLALDTTKSFSIAAWTRLTDLTTTSTLLAKDAASGQSSPFRLRARPLASGGNAWCLSMVAAATATSGTEVCSTVANTANQWVHVAAGFDRAEGRIKVWVNGLETSAAFTAPITNGRGIVVGQGVDAVAGPGDRLRGNVADLQVFDRLLVAEDFTGHTAGATLDGDVDVPGILDPIEVGWWTFSRGFNCRDETNQATCLASADDPFGRQLRTTLGTEIKTGGHDGRAMFLDDLLVDGEAPNSKPEYGQSQRNTGTADVPAWAYAPVLRTDQSFSVSAWVNPDDFGTGAHTIVSQDGPDRTPFGLSLRPATVAGVTADRWTFSMVPSSGTGGDVVISLSRSTTRTRRSGPRRGRLRRRPQRGPAVRQRCPGETAHEELPCVAGLRPADRRRCAVQRGPYRPLARRDRRRARLPGALSDLQVRDLFQSELRIAVS